MVRFADNRFARNPAQGMPAVSFLFALKFALGVTDAKESNGAVGGGFERCVMDQLWNR
jgi:hypothetical protein